MINKTIEMLDKDLKTEMEELITYNEALIQAVDEGKHHDIMIPVNTYSKHLAVLYLCIECLKHEVFVESKITGQHAAYNRMAAWMASMGLP